MKNRKSALIKCIIQYYLFVFGFLISIFLLSVLFNNIRIFYIGVVLILIFLIPIFSVLANKNFLPPLFIDLDPEKFKDKIDVAKSFQFCIPYRMYYAFYSGDYRQTVNICTAMLKKKMITRYKLRYLSFVGKVYFELGDSEKLKLVCDKFDEWSAKSRPEGILKEAFAIYREYSNGNFEKCLDLYKNSKCKVKPGSIKYKLFSIYSELHYAILLYKAQHAEEAAKHFEKVISEGPKLNSSVIAKNYLDDINGVKELSTYDEVLPDEDCRLLSPKIESNIRICKIILSISVILLMILIIFNLAK